MRVFFIIFVIYNYSFGQLILSADPYGLIRHEQFSFINNDLNKLQTILRPQIYSNYNDWSIILSNEIFYNDGAPNLQNVSERYIGMGAGYFTAINFSFLGKFFLFSLEPYYLINQNKDVNNIYRESDFEKLNDFRYHNEKPYKRFGLRESHFYLNYKEYGLGISNANMWWGPGLHTSLTMSNNTIGFPHLLIGTIREKKYKNLGYNFRYVFANMDKTKGNPSFNGIVARVTFYTEPIITLGINRNILISNYNNYTYQILAGYFTLDFPKSRLRVFFELGTTDKWNNFIDLINYPDHGIGSIFGFRHYEAFNNKSLVIGFEYARLAHSSYWGKRPTPNWYGNSFFDNSSYDGRRWAAHSGSDSDDLYIYFGYQNARWSFIPSLNYERHGIVYARPAEVKMEFRIDFRYIFDEFNIGILFEREWIEHAGFIMDNWRIGNVICIRFEKNISNLFSNKSKSFKN